MRPLRLVLAASLLAALALLPAGVALARPFSSGVAAGEVTPSGALLWTRADRSGSVLLEVGRGSSVRRPVQRVRLRASRADDLTVQRRLRGLKAGTRYAYRFRAGSRRSETGRFTTAPRPSSTTPVRFGWTGDADPVRSGRNLLFAPFSVYARMAAEGNAFNVNLGDTIYSDTDSKLERTDPLALTVAQKRAKYRTVLSAANLRRLRASSGSYAQWDDHEFLNDFARGQTDYPTAQGTAEGAPARIQKVNGERLYRDGVQTFREYQPVTYTPRNGLYRSFRWGRNLEVFFLDERSFRDVGADDGPVCQNPPGSGQRDFAPTAPQRLRTLFSALVPSLRNPVPPGCLERIRDPRRTLLGARQYARFTSAVKRSTATFKVIMNELPIQQFYADPYDRWEGYEAERQRLVNFLRTQTRNVVFLTADVHANLVNDVRLQTLEDGGPVNSGLLEVTTGPAGTDSFAQDLVDTTNNPAAPSLANSAFFTKPPPDGPGIRCSNLNTFSYGQVEVTSAQLSIALRDSRGRPVVGADGRPCGPYVLRR